MQDFAVLDSVAHRPHPAPNRVDVATAGGASLRVWTESTRDEAQPTTAPKDAMTIELTGRRDSYQTCQVVVGASSQGGLLGVARDAPWGTNHTAFSKTGDGVLLYPGNHDGENSPRGSPRDVSLDGPIPSYRLKMIRAGLQDWALFALADELGLGEYARERVGEVYGQFHGCDWDGCAPPISGFYWKTDVEKMQRIREDIASAIIETQ